MFTKTIFDYTVEVYTIKKMINYKYYPNTNYLPDCLNDLIKIFKISSNLISSENKGLKSTEIFKILQADIIKAGFLADKKNLSTPVLYGKNGEILKDIEYDAINKSSKVVLAIEAGQAVLNNKYTKNFLEVAMIQEVEYLAMAVSNLYKPESSINGFKDFETVTNFFDALYQTNRVTTNLKGLLIIGY